jgi:hypothetical protein
MKICKLSMIAMVVIFAMIYAPFSYGAVSPEEAAKLGTTLTLFGAEKAGNKEGTIPAYTGGLTTPPANFKPGSGIRPDPFASEKPLFSIDARNMNQYADKLIGGTKALMKKYPTFRIDIYKTHRTVAYPEFVLKNTVKNAVTAKTYRGGVSLKDAHGGFPFPIPKDAYEVMWNHLLRYQGRGYESKTGTDIVDANGAIYSTAVNERLWQEFPYYSEDLNRDDLRENVFWKLRWLFAGPVRKAGEGGQAIMRLNMAEFPTVAHLYLPGQRRVKLAPECAFDTPSTDGAGNVTYDETWLFNASMERYNWKILGKKEMYVPYNTYKACYYPGKKEDMYGPKHMNPDLVRWELHRMWVVEATLKPGKRHIYAKRVLYLDEDNWTTLAEDLYDAQGNMFKSDYMFVTQSYDTMSSASMAFVIYNLTNGIYLYVNHNMSGGWNKEMAPKPERWWSPDVLAGKGLR